jgi:hypothetical protein
MLCDFLFLVSAPLRPAARCFRLIDAFSPASFIGLDLFAIGHLSEYTGVWPICNMLLKLKKLGSPEPEEIPLYLEQRAKVNRSRNAEIIVAKP